MYRTLCNAAFYCEDRPYLPDDDNELWMLAGCESHEQWEENKVPVRKMFTQITKAGKVLLSRKRILDDWQRMVKKRREIKNARADAGRRGGLASGKSRINEANEERPMQTIEDTTDVRKQNEANGSKAEANLSKGQANEAKRSEVKKREVKRSEVDEFNSHTKLNLVEPQKSANPKTENPSAFGDGQDESMDLPESEGTRILSGRGQ
jgi:hypothetical protein